MNTNAIKEYDETIIPVAKFRGIRQHINFPMDISSYTLKDAKQYIQNLARMRFNFITFHSYPGQWYEVKKKDTIEYAEIPLNEPIATSKHFDAPAAPIYKGGN